MGGRHREVKSKLGRRNPRKILTERKCKHLRDLVRFRFPLVRMFRFLCFFPLPKWRLSERKNFPNSRIFLAFSAHAEKNRLFLLTIWWGMTSKNAKKKMFLPFLFQQWMCLAVHQRKILPFSFLKATWKCVTLCELLLIASSAYNETLLEHAEWLRKAHFMALLFAQKAIEILFRLKKEMHEKIKPNWLRDSISTVFFTFTSSNLTFVHTNQSFMGGLFSYFLGCSNWYTLSGRYCTLFALLLSDFLFWFQSEFDFPSSFGADSAHGDKMSSFSERCKIYTAKI